MILLIAAALGIPREDALDNASQYGTHVWTSTEANTVADCTSGYESAYEPGTHVGLPYDWGGYMTLDEFDAQIADGYGAGSHSWHGSLSCTAGVDCSGFVSKVWDTGHYGTSTFYQVTTDIDASELTRGDVFNDAGSHMTMFTHISEDGWPVYWESSGSAEGVRLNSTGGWSSMDGYQPARFDEIEDGSSTGTSTTPKEITAFPYTHYGWTAGAASDVFDVYACSDADESGPEVLYRATLPGPGTVTVVVSDADGVDIDVHVLTAADADTCVGRDDTEVTAHVDGPELWLALDTYVGDQEYSGPYVLTVDFVEDPIDSGDSAETDSGLGSPGLDTGWFGPPGTMTGLDAVDDCGCATGSGGGVGLIALAVMLSRRRRT